jgi:hypothetical protein
MTNAYRTSTCLSWLSMWVGIVTFTEGKRETDDKIRFSYIFLCRHKF